MGAIAGLASGATLALDRLLWIPGQKLISIPPPSAGLYLRFLYYADERWSERQVTVSDSPLSFPDWTKGVCVTLTDRLSVAHAEEQMDAFIQNPHARVRARQTIQRVLHRKDFMTTVDFREAY